MKQASVTKALTTLLTCAVVSLGATDAGAVGTRRFVLDSLSAFEGGDLAGVALASDGTVQAGWNLADAPVPDASSVWSSVVLGDGTVLLGTGAGGRIYKVKNGKIEIAAETKAMAVSSMVLGFDGDVLAGTFPEGKIFRIPTGKLDGSEVEPWVELKETEDVWSLVYDDKGKALYAATGPQGKLFRITAGGKEEVYFDSEEAHLVSVALGHDGSVYVGSNGKALLYHLTGPGRASVVHDFEGDDVRAIALAPADKGGALYAIANDYGGSMTGLRARKRGGGLTSGPEAPKPAKPGKGQLWRFDPSGVAEKMMNHGDTHYITLALDADGAPYVGSGHDGKVFTVDDHHVVRLVADTDERQIGAMAVTGAARFVATTDPVVFHAIKGSGGADAVWTSKALDAGLRAHFGKLDWRADGALELETRSGNTSEPDDSWSAWSGPLGAPGKVKSPPARFLQIRARWAKDAAAVLRQVEVAFVTDNARALITEVTAGETKSDTGGSKVPESGTAPNDPSTKLKIQWKVENPDSDQIRYRLFYRREGDKAWFAILESSEELTKTDYTWDTSGLPEGRYRVRVDASDELSNPPDRVTRHSLESTSVVVDNTAPLLTALTLAGGRLQGTATDEIGPIARIEFALVGKKSWYPIFPKDGIFDEPSESFDVDVAALVPEGPHFVVVRAYDAAGNRVERTAGRAP